MYTNDELEFLERAAIEYTRLLFTTEKQGTWEFLTKAAWNLARVALDERRKFFGHSATRGPKSAPTSDHNHELGSCSRVAPILVAQKARIKELEKSYPRVECPICARVLTLAEIKGGTCNAGHAGSSDIEAAIRTQLGWSGDTAEERHLKRIAELEKRLAEQSGPALQRIEFDEPMLVKAGEAIGVELPNAPTSHHVHELGSCSFCDKRPRMCANCEKPEGMHYDPLAKADTCCCFRSKPTQNS